MKCAYCGDEYRHRADIVAECYRCRAEDLYRELKEAREERNRAYMLAAASWGALAAVVATILYLATAGVV